MAEDTVRLGGLPYRTSDPEQSASALENGGSLISEAEAGSNAGAQADNSYVDANWGNAGKFGMGAFGGLTLGMGPGALAHMGLVNPGHLRSAEGSPWYTAGDVAGTIAPALLTGGESLGARGLAMTPSGLMGRAGGLAENWAGRLLGDSAGLLGKLGSMPVKMAARGMAEGGLINMGHAIGDALIDNKPLAAEAIGAAGLDGALFGGLMGGSLGLVGGLGSLAVDSLGALGKKAAAGHAGGVANVGKSLGMEGEALSEAGAKGKVGQYGEILHGNGSSIGDSVHGQQAATAKAIDTYSGARKEVIDALSKDTTGAIDGFTDRLLPRLKTDVVYPRLGSPLAPQAEREVEKFWGSFTAEKPMGRAAWNEANNFKSYAQWQEDGLALNLKGTAKRAAYDSYKQYSDVQFSDYAKSAVTTLGKAEFPKTWEGLIQARDSLEKELVGKVNNPLLPTRDTIKREILNAVDHEIGQAMDGASAVPGNEGLADKYRGATQSLQVARELEGHLGKKLTNQMQSSGSGITGADAGWAMTGAALGHPVSAVGLLAAKGISRKLQPKATAWMAQMAYNQSFGTKAASATQELKAKVSSSLKAYFSNATKAASKAPVTSANIEHAKAKPGSDRKAYEDMASRTEQLVSSNHQAQVQKYAESMAQAGYTDLAQSILDVNHRAVMYTMNNAPPRQGTKQMQSMHKLPTSKTPTLQEFKYMRQMKGVMGGPHAVIDGLMDGSLSRDTVQAVAFTYPEAAGYIAEQAQTEIMEMKARGDFMPMDKITRLSVALNSPLDTTMTGEYVSAVQSSLATPDAQQKPQQPQGHPGGSLGEMGMAMMTPLQTITIGQQA